ncbi:uncharacterized protein LOC121258765 [Juglans microcarpa x Juglans regia]|uniref:uncharacterized protein LOC121258765 n=1 Tax=Juglans microcarpa x Juglans regia TaxID=2249226 RepID=UPI001B7F18AD|nr:uncharacterized protein LOC121258765 [Juglans microcarpa x Juglans regia]
MVLSYVPLLQSPCSHLKEDPLSCQPPYAADPASDFVLDHHRQCRHHLKNKFHLEIQPPTPFSLALCFSVSPISRLPPTPPANKNSPNLTAGHHLSYEFYIPPPPLSSISSSSFSQPIQASDVTGSRQTTQSDAPSSSSFASAPAAIPSSTLSTSHAMHSRSAILVSHIVDISAKWDFLGGDLAVTAFADLSFDLPIKWLRDRGIHGHIFAGAGNLAKLTENEFRNFFFRKFLESFRSSVGVGIVVPTKLFRLEGNFYYIVKQHDHDRGKTGFRFSFSAPS